MPSGQWIRQKSTLYREAKRLALITGNPHPNWRRSTILQLQQYLDVNTTQADVIHQQQRDALIEMRRQRRRNRSGVFNLRFTGDEDEETFGNRLKTLMNNDSNYYISVSDDDGNVIRLRRSNILNSSSNWNKFYNLYHVLSRILENNDDYSISTNYIKIQLHKQVNQNPPLRNQRDGCINCACKAVLEKLATLKQTPQVKRRISHTKELNKTYFSTGINDTGLQLLSNKARLILIIEDKLKKKWREFHPQSKGDFAKLLLVSHNNHIEEICDSDDEEEDPNDLENPNNSIMVGLDPDMPLKQKPRDLGQSEYWFDTNAPVIEFANDYEASGKEGTAIISKGNLVAYITDNDIYKTKFYQHEIYPECFTSGGVGKQKFIEQHPEFKYGINDEDPFYQLLMDADRSGFYFRNGQGKVKYDQNHSYKSFKSSGIFQGFPNLEAIFEVDKCFSDFMEEDNEDFFGCDCDGTCDFCKASEYDDMFVYLKNNLDKYDYIADEIFGKPKTQQKHGLLYIEYETLTLHDFEKQNNVIYECSGWYPIEIVKSNYEKYGINPLVKQYAYASSSFDVDFSDYTNDQFRTFLGKCISQGFDEVWKTTSYDEFMRARYILKDKIVNISQRNNVFEITFTPDQKPWNMPVISAYVKAHQKYNIFNQYNRIISNNVKVNAISVDSIEVSEKCDHLFNMKQWKLEKLKSNNSKPFIIEREPVRPTMTGLPFKQEYLLPKYLHYSGAGGNGKTETIINLAKAYKKAMFIAPTQSAVKNLIDRAKQLGVEIRADTYHRVFGFGCVDRFPRDKYNKYFLDECSMVSAPVLTQMMEKIPSLIISGDFWQLPCVDDESIYDNWNHEKKSPEYEKFEIRELTKNWRQESDPEFYEFCNKLRQKLTKSEAMELLEKLNSRIIPQGEIIQNDTLDDIQICGINSQVDAINNKHKLEVGCKVICNIKCYDLEKKMIPNGSVGIITQMKPFKVEWEDGSISTFKGIGKNNSGKARFTPAFSLTVHKCQGRTLKRNVIINPSRLFAKNHLYVSLTRATCFNNIYLTQKMNFNVFCKTVFVEGYSHQPKSGSEQRIQRMVNQYKREEPNLTEQYLNNMRTAQKNECCYCSINMSNAYGQPQSITLERIDDTKRHIIGNLKLACFACNSSHRK